MKYQEMLAKINQTFGIANAQSYFSQNAFESWMKKPTALLATGNGTLAGAPYNDVTLLSEEGGSTPPASFKTTRKISDNSPN